MRHKQISKEIMLLIPLVIYIKIKAIITIYCKKIKTKILNLRVCFYYNQPCYKLQFGRKHHKVGLSTIKPLVYRLLFRRTSLYFAIVLRSLLQESPDRLSTVVNLETTLSPWRNLFLQSSFACKLHFVTMIMLSLILNGLGVLTKTELYCNVCSLQNDIPLHNIYTQEVRWWIKSILMFPENNCSFKAGFH